MRKGTPELRLFSLWMPTALVVLMIVAPAVLYFWANSDEARSYTDPSRKTAECSTAAAIAQEMSLQIAEKNRRRAARIAFSPLLHGVPPFADYGRRQNVLQTVKSILVIPMRFDCGAEFRRYPLRIATSGMPEPNDYVREKYWFSRVGLSQRNTLAYVAVGMSCGGLCGYGQFAIWQKRHGRWVQILSRPTWVA